MVSPGYQPWAGWHIESTHPKDGPLESSHHPTTKSFFLFYSRGVWNSKTTPMSHNHLSSSIEIQTLLCLLLKSGLSNKHRSWRCWRVSCSLANLRHDLLFPLTGTGSRARACTGTRTCNIPVGNFPRACAFCWLYTQQFLVWKALSQNGVDSGLGNDSD